MLRSRPEESPLGIAISAAAVLIMSWLWFMKRRIAARIDSGALCGDAANFLTCGYMVGSVLVGVLLNALFHWWRTKGVAALVFLFFLVAETREALEEARGEGGTIMMTEPKRQKENHSCRFFRERGPLRSIDCFVVVSAQSPPEISGGLCADTTDPGFFAGFLMQNVGKSLLIESQHYLQC
ncbi:cation transporter [Ktedonobacter sp. SOSP1-52]|uniref:cation transporter n=1 Tax=Ktedonobacter sp. SOSP1-52 TaxID=2778366 RepID=UPI0035AF90BB